MNKKKLNKKLQKLLVKISRILGSIVICIVVLLLIPLTFPRILKYETFNVVSGSMEPEISVGSLLMVKRVDPFEIKEGDIITFYSNAVVVSHRVIRNNTFERSFTTKGDANENEDLNDTSYNDYIGKVEAHIPLIGLIGSYISTASGKLLIVELLVCALLLFAVSDKVKI